MTDVVRERERKAWDHAVMTELKKWAGRPISWLSCEQTEADRKTYRDALLKSRIGKPDLYAPLEVTRMLDTMFGIDGFLLVNGRFVPTAKRIQFKSTTTGWRYQTITVRAKRLTGHRTELQKLKSDSTLKPELFVHAYIDDGHPKSYAWEAQRVFVVYREVIARCDSWSTRTNNRDDTEFRAYHLNDLKQTAHHHRLPTPIVLGPGYMP